MIDLKAYAEDFAREQFQRAVSKPLVMTHLTEWEGNRRPIAASCRKPLDHYNVEAAPGVRPTCEACARLFDEDAETAITLGIR